MMIKRIIFLITPTAVVAYLATGSGSSKVVDADICVLDQQCTGTVQTEQI